MIATADIIDGTAMRPLFVTRFQINAEVPLTMAPDVQVSRVQYVYGSLQQAVTVSAVGSGEMFLKGKPPIEAIMDSSSNPVGPANPLPKGQALAIFATGLGAVTQSVTVTPSGLGIPLTLKVGGQAGNSILVALQQWEY